MTWSIKKIAKRFEEIKNLGFIEIPENMHRTDDGIVGQILERQFKIKENNLSKGDLGLFELKGMRTHSKTLTLCHKKTDTGLTPIQIFDKYGYVKPSSRDAAILKKKLFTTIKGNRENNLGFQLKALGSSKIALLHKNKQISTWNLSESLSKIDNIFLGIAETQGLANSKHEKFHFVKAFFCEGLKDLSDLITEGTIVIDLCIDQLVDDKHLPLKRPHDRGPHIRIQKSKLLHAYKSKKCSTEFLK